MSTMHLNTLKENLDEEKKKHLFPCIKDLVANGLKLERLPEGNYPPSRQEITQYLASWCKYIGMDADKCLEWMLDYCTNVLSVLSSSSNSKIRHSTKSNIKYIYNSEIKFECKREENPFKAHCDSTCPVYKEIVHVIKERRKPDFVQSFEPVVDWKICNGLTASKLSIKDVHKEQFEKAMTIVRDCLDQGVPKKGIVSLLNERDFKTRTGRKWSYATLTNELQRLSNKQTKMPQVPTKG